jgi:flagellar biosynthesis chaperone FliJ
METLKVSILGGRLAYFPFCKAEREEMDCDDEVQHALEILEDKWKQILGHWKGRGGETLDPSDMLNLQQNLDTLQRHIKTVQAIKGLMETMEQIEEELKSIMIRHWGAGVEKEEEKADIKAKLKFLHHENESIYKEMKEMYLDEYFMGRYMGSMNDYRVHTLPLPNGFMCHKTYQTELERLKKTIDETQKEVDDKKEALQKSQCEGHNVSVVVY